MEKKLYKYFYKLREKLLMEKDDNNIYKLLSDIATLEDILNTYYDKNEDLYMYDIYKFNKHIKFLEKNDNDRVKKTFNELRGHTNTLSNIFRHSYNILDNTFLNDKFEVQSINEDEFYDTIEKLPLNIKNCIMDELKRKNIFMIDVEDAESANIFNGSEYYFESLEKSYYFIEQYHDYSYFNIFGIIHEISHAYVDKKYNKNTVLNVYREVTPIFNELIYNEHLRANNMACNDRLLNLKLILSNLKSNLKNRFEFRTSNSMDLYQLYMYTFGTIVSLSFFNNYLEDNEKAKYYIDYFCKNIDMYEPFLLLKKSGINIDELASGDTVKKITKYYSNNFNQNSKR